MILLHSIVTTSLTFTSKILSNLALFFLWKSPQINLWEGFAHFQNAQCMSHRFQDVSWTQKSYAMKPQEAILAPPRQLKSAWKMGTTTQDHLKTPQDHLKTSRRRPKTTSRRLQGAHEASKTPPRLPQTLQDASKTPSNWLKSEYETASRMFHRDGCQDN